MAVQHRQNRRYFAVCSSSNHAGFVDVVWIPPVKPDTNFPRIADALPVGIRGATAVPVRPDGRITAVVECFFNKAIDDDSGVLAEVETLVNQ